MARVFMIEDCRNKRKIAMKEAEDFGEVHFIFDGVSKRPSIWSKDFAVEASKRFEKARFDPEEDYFAIGGYFIPVVLAVVELVLDYGEIRVLFYSATDKCYMPRKLGERDINDENTGKISRDCEESSSLSS